MDCWNQLVRKLLLRKLWTGGPFSWVCKWWAICWELRFSRDWIDPATWLIKPTNGLNGDHFGIPFQIWQTPLFAFDSCHSIYPNIMIHLHTCTWDLRWKRVLCFESWLCWQKLKSRYIVGWKKQQEFPDIYSLLKPLLYIKSFEVTFTVHNPGEILLQWRATFGSMWNFVVIAGLGPGGLGYLGSPYLFGIAT